MRRGVNVLGVFVLLVTTALPAEAEQSGGLPSSSFAEDEQEAYQLYTEDRLLTARRLAEQVLERNPDSVVGHFILGSVYRRAEGSLANAMFHLGRAREIYESRWGTSRAGSAAWQLHREILFAVQQVAGEMEEWDYQLHIIEYHDMLYDPDLYAEHAWPLIQLGRYDLARQFADVAARSSDAFQRSLGLNALCAIEGEAQQRQSYYDACIAALRNAESRAANDTETGPDQGTSLAVHAYNAALAAQSVLRHDEAERLAMIGTRRLEFTPANPWRLLTRLYVDQGRMDDAVEALREMHRWRTRQPPHLRDQDRAETDAAFASLLLIAGETSIAHGAVTRAVDRPDRRALTSGRAEQALGAHALLRRAVFLLDLAKQEEERSTQGFLSRLFSPFVMAWQRIDTWPDEERVTSVLSDDEVLKATLQIYVQGGLDPVPVWMLGDLIDILGPGVVEESLDRIGQQDTFEGLHPYHQTLRAEIALSRGQEDRALAVARSALDQLPSSEVVLRSRVAAVGAEAARQMGRESDSAALFEQSIQGDGGVIRRLRLSIPASVSVRGGSSVAGEVATMLRRSPRMRHSTSGFRVTVSGDVTDLRVCLLNRQSSVVRCTETISREEVLIDPEPQEPEETTEEEESSDSNDEASEPEEEPRRRLETLEELARRAALIFHDRIFAMPAQLTTTDVSSLDGRIRADEEVSRERLRGLLNDVIEESSSNLH